MLQDSETKKSACPGGRNGGMEGGNPRAWSARGLSEFSVRNLAGRSPWQERVALRLPPWSARFLSMAACPPVSQGGLLPGADGGWLVPCSPMTPFSASPASALAHRVASLQCSPGRTPPSGWLAQLPHGQNPQHLNNQEALCLFSRDVGWPTVPTVLVMRGPPHHLSPGTLDGLPCPVPVFP